MSTSTEKLRKATLKVTPSSRKTAGSTSGLLRVNTRSAAASHSRKSFSLTGDSRLLEKGPAPVTGQGAQVSQWRPAGHGDENPSRRPKTQEGWDASSSQGTCRDTNT